MTPFDELNERFGIITVGNKVVVMETEPNDGGSIVELWPFEEFKKLMIKRRVKLQSADGSTSRTVNLAVEWLTSSKGHQYRRLVYAMPGSGERLRAGDYNGYRGFTVQPELGDWSKNRDHLLNVICGGNRSHFEWLFNWCAALVQQPGQHAWSAVVLRGGQGIGKGHFADKMLGKLFYAQQYLHMIGANQLTADFNEHLSGKVLVFADEATWGGDPRHAAKLKGLVTEDNVPIHRKFLKMVEEPSALHIVIASNTDWPIPAEWDDRRFFVVDVSEQQKQNESYFGPLVGELNDGGRAAMLHDLLAHSVDWAALRHPPDTEAKRDIKARSLSADDKWLVQWLSDDAGTWAPRQPRSVIWQHYETFHARSGSPKSVDSLGRFLKGIFKRAKVTGEWPKAAKMQVFGKRVNAWEFPALPEFREIVDTALGLKIEWPDL